jgi:hypothetical protein
MLMAKKKNKPVAKPAVLNDRSYLVSGRARQLPIYTCSINADWVESGLAQICVVRKHINGHITAGIYLVDTFCAGVKDTFSFFNIPEWEFNERLSYAPGDREKCSYTLAHNIIYGALAFAQDYGIAPHPDFSLTRFILEEDTEAVPLMELEFGRNGKPFLVMGGNARDAYFLRQLEKHAGRGNYEVVGALEMEEDEEEEEFWADPASWERADWEDFIKQTPPEDLGNYPAVASYIYRKTVPMPADAAPVVEQALHPRPFNLSEDILPEEFNRLSPEEQKEIMAVYPDLYGGMEDASEGALQKLIQRLKSNTARWPQNPLFYQYLSDAQQWAKQPEAAKATIRELYAKFPDFLVGRLRYGQLLVEEGKLEEVLELLAGQYHVAALQPERETFYIDQMVNFYMLLCAYFLEKDQFYLAHLYFTLLMDLKIPSHLPLNFFLLLQLNQVVKEAMKPVLEKAQQSEADTQALIDLLAA